MSTTPVSARTQNAASAPQSARGRALVVVDVVVAAIVERSAFERVAPLIWKVFAFAASSRLDEP